jgi:hypothetical protein
VFIDLSQTEEGEMLLEKVDTIEDARMRFAEAIEIAKGRGGGSEKRREAISKTLEAYFEENKIKGEHRNMWLDE